MRRLGMCEKPGERILGSGEFVEFIKKLQFEVIGVDISHPAIEKTIKVWQPQSLDIITQEDAIEIIENTVNFFSLLIELENKYGKK